MADNLEQTNIAEPKPQRLVSSRNDVVDPPKDNPDQGLVEGKFAGKSAADIAAAYEALESKLGQQANELGQLRSIVNATPEPEPIDFYEDPEKAIEAQVAQQMAPIKRAEFERKVSAKHGDWEQVAEDPEFHSWVYASKARQLLLNEAAARSDEAAAIELLDNWKATQKEPAEVAVKRDRAARRAATEPGTPRRAQGKTYRRAELRNLQKQNPAQYQAQLPEIRDAYASGRVKD